MKIQSFFKFAAVAAMFAVAFSSCTKELETTANPERGITFNCSISDGTKTAFNGKEIWWSEGDSIRFYQRYYKNADDESQSNSYVTRKVASDVDSYSTTISFTTPAKFPASYFATYPNYAYKGLLLVGDRLAVDMKLSNAQTPTEDSYDPHGDLLISEYVTAEDSKMTSFNLAFKRLVAFGKMNITGIPTESAVTNVYFSAVHDGADVRVGGERYFYLDNGDLYSTKTYSTMISLDYSSLELSQSLTANFCTYPFELETGDTFKVTVLTADSRRFIKNVTIPDDMTLVFERDHGTKFSVDMSSTWFSASVSSTNSSKITIWYYTKDVSKINYAIFKASALDGIDQSNYESTVFNHASTYGSSLYAMGSSSLATINENGSIGLNYTKLSSSVSIEAETDYVVMLRATDNDSNTQFLYFNVTTPAATE